MKETKQKMGIGGSWRVCEDVFLNITGLNSEKIVRQLVLNGEMPNEGKVRDKFEEMERLIEKSLL